MNATASIIENCPYATFINIFKVEPKNQAEVARLLAQANDDVMCKISGYITSTVHASDDGEMVVNYVQWESKESFMDIFKYPQAITHMKHITPLVVWSERHFFKVGRVQLPSDRGALAGAGEDRAVPSLSMTYEGRLTTGARNADH